MKKHEEEHNSLQSEAIISKNAANVHAGNRNAKTRDENIATVKSQESSYLADKAHADLANQVGNIEVAASPMFAQVHLADRSNNILYSQIRSVLLKKMSAILLQGLDLQSFQPSLFSNVLGANDRACDFQNVKSVGMLHRLNILHKLDNQSYRVHHWHIYTKQDALILAIKLVLALLTLAFWNLSYFFQTQIRMMNAFLVY